MADNVYGIDVTYFKEFFYIQQILLKKVKVVYILKVLFFFSGGGGGVWGCRFIFFFAQGTTEVSKHCSSHYQ